MSIQIGGVNPGLAEFTLMLVSRTYANTVSMFSAALDAQ